MSRLLKYILVMAALCCAAEASARIFTKRDYEAMGRPAHCVIPDGVTEIDSYSFHGCTSLVKVTIPDSVVEMDLGICEISIPPMLQDEADEIGKMDGGNLYLAGLMQSSPFEGCTSLRVVYVGKNSPLYESLVEAYGEKGVRIKKKR